MGNWRPFSAAIALLLLAIPAGLSAQTIRFRTSVGAFDMRLNPTNNPNLQEHVDKIAAYVGAGRYHAGVVNRADDGDPNVPDDDFVLQLGGFMADGMDPNEVPVGGFDAVDRFDPVVVDADGDGQVDFDTSGLTNTRGTVSLALASGDPNSGTSSFFVNLGDNSTLDNQGFVPFAVIDNMATIDRIMALDRVDLSRAIGAPGNLAYTDVPLTNDGGLVVLETVTVVSDSNFSFIGPLRDAYNLDPTGGSGSGSTLLDTLNGALGASSTSSGMAGLFEPAAVVGPEVPEPAALALVLTAGAACAGRRRRR